MVCHSAPNSAIQEYPKRELTYQRDLFMVQTAMVICDPATIFATMVDRFDLTEWVRGNYHPMNREKKRKL